MKFRVTEEQFIVVPPGAYPAVVESYETATGKYGPMISFTFRLLNYTAPDGSSVTVRGICSAPKEGKLTMGMKLAKWAAAILGTPLHPGMDLDLDMLIGRQCIVTVTNTVGTDAQGNQVTYNNVADVSPANTPMPPQPQQVMQPVPPTPSQQFVPQTPQQPVVPPTPVQPPDTSSNNVPSSTTTPPNPFSNSTMDGSQLNTPQTLPNSVGNFPIPNFGNNNDDQK